jgi:hypothetical protein
MTIVGIDKSQLELQASRKPTPTAAKAAAT